MRGSDECRNHIQILAPVPREIPPISQGRQPAHVREAERIQTELIRLMTPGRRLQIAQELYDTAWQLKEASLVTSIRTGPMPKFTPNAEGFS